MATPEQAQQQQVQQQPPPQYYAPQQQYPPYMHPMPPKESGLLGLFTPTLVLLGIGIAALLIFVGVIINLFVSVEIGMILGLLGEAGGFIVAFGGAYFGKEFTRDQRLGLYIVSAAFLFGLAFP